MVASGLVGASGGEGGFWGGEGDDAPGVAQDLGGGIDVGVEGLA
jgi:hypothetical protein